MKKVMSPEDEERNRRASKLTELAQSEAWTGYLKPFIATLLLDWPDPQKYTDEHKLMIDYTYKCGMTDAVKKILKELEEQPAILKAIEKKYSGEEKQGVI